MSSVFETINSNFAVGGDYASKNKIVNITNHILLPASNPIRPHIQRCPAPSNNFTGRHDELDRMQRFFFPEETPRKARGKRKAANVLLLIGLGGSGKSQLAYQYIHNWLSDEESIDPEDIFFLDASTRTTLNNGLTSIAHSKGLGDQSEYAINWMAQHKKPWFLFIDNADDSTINLYDYLPRSTKGRILITTRLREAGQQYGSGPDSEIILEGMKPEEALELLATTARFEEGEDEGAEEFVKKLGYLALALVQAGAAIYRRNLSLTQYDELYDRVRSELIEQESIHGLKRQSLSGYKKTIYTTWILCYENLPGLSKRLLSFCAFLHHSGITENIFQDAAKTIKAYQATVKPTREEAEALDDLRDFLEAISDNPLALPKSMQAVCSHSPMIFDKKTKTYSIHPLVHEWLEDMKRTAIQVSFMLSIPVHVGRTEHDDLLLFRMIPHIDRVSLDKTGHVLDVHPDVGCIFAKAYLAAGKYPLGVDLVRQAMEKRSAILGVDDPATISALSSLAIALKEIGQWSDAESMARRVVERWSQHPPERTPELLSARKNLAYILRERGKWKEAAELAESTVQSMISSEQLGADHADTISAMAILASCQRELGNPSAAESVERSVVEGCTRLWGDDNPRTLSAKSNLATTLRKLGPRRRQEAAEIQEEVVDRSTRVLGKGHPDTVTALKNLAAILGKLV